MSQHIVSTPVRYNSVVYRSASEARLVVFLTILRIPFVPQPRAYAVDGIGYLPDFELPHRLWVEVKGAYEPQSTPDGKRCWSCWGLGAR